MALARGEWWTQPTITCKASSSGSKILRRNDHGYQRAVPVWSRILTTLCCHVAIFAFASSARGKFKRARCAKGTWKVNKRSFSSRNTSLFDLLDGKKDEKGKPRTMSLELPTSSPAPLGGEMSWCSLSCTAECAAAQKTCAAEDIQVRPAVVEFLMFLSSDFIPLFRVESNINCCKS